MNDLIQYINDINTDGADAALDSWRKAQEEKKISIDVEISGADDPNVIKFFDDSTRTPKTQAEVEAAR